MSFSRNGWRHVSGSAGWRKVCEKRKDKKTQIIEMGMWRWKHTWYLSFLVCHRSFWSVNCTPEKCVICDNNLPRKSILGILAVLVGVLAVLVGVLAILVGILGVLCIWMVYLLHEIEHSELGLVYQVFSLKKDVRISVYILWMNFAKNSPLCVLWGKYSKN